MLLAVALVATAVVTALPSAAAETIVDCLLGLHRAVCWLASPKRRVELRRACRVPARRGRAGVWSQGGPGERRDEGAVEEDQLEVGLEAGFSALLKRSLVSSES